MLEQYFEIKRQVPDAIVFYRLGDFYEMFFEDAERAAPILDLVLTARGKGGDSEAPMCGVPYHAADQYIAKLVRSGISVALCDQIGDASASKGLVAREITRVITPGTAVEASLLERDSRYLLSFVENNGDSGAAFLDVSTGDFFVTSYSGGDDPRLTDDLVRFAPREAIYPRTTTDATVRAIAGHGLAAAPGDEALFDQKLTFELLTRHFGTATLRGFGLESDDSRVAAAGAALRYASTSHKRDLSHVSRLRVDSDADCLILDAATLENLEIFESRDSSRPRASLWNVVNATRTAMGGRTLRKWLCRPLRGMDAIFDRQDAVAELIADRRVHETILGHLASIADLERLTSRVALGSAGPRECIALASSLSTVALLEDSLSTMRGPLLCSIRGRLDSLDAVVSAITRMINPEAPNSVRDGGVIREGVDTELDSLRLIARDSKTVLHEIESAERTRSGIPSLKIRFNSVFGYYIEVSKANLARVPSEYIRKQTLVNAERYITPELKELEEKILGAEDRSKAIEASLYERLLTEIAGSSGKILATAAAVGELDSLVSLATVAMRGRFVRPALSPHMEVSIEEGRHPVIESISTERFIPNDTEILREKNGIQIITGPNMGGKSTYLRQVALIVLLNQIGSFVPASRARLGIFDRIFTRVGASDHLARGESTFMVEMHETANILNNATEQSLIVLDEVGRGTATFDGLSLAWAIVEFLHDAPSGGAITLFATHYHELTDLAKTKQRVTNQSVAVKEWNDQIIFLRKVVPGAADKSYGIQVAKLAGIPEEIIGRAREILSTLERHERDIVEETRRTGQNQKPPDPQLPLFLDREGEAARRIRELAIDELSPLEALNILSEIRKRLVD